MALPGRASRGRLPLRVLSRELSGPLSLHGAPASGPALTQLWRGHGGGDSGFVFKELEGAWVIPLRLISQESRASAIPDF